MPPVEGMTGGAVSQPGLVRRRGSTGNGTRAGHSEQPGPGTIDLDGLGLLAGPANVVMQLAWPPIGYGVAESTVESGQLFRHPLKRTRTTLSYLAVALLGTDEDRRSYRGAVNRSHAAVRSSPASPVAYDAFDPELQMWVAACLYVGLEDIHVRAHGQLEADEADAFYRRSAPLGTTLQVRADQWPRDRAAFQRYWEAGLARVAIDAPVRRYLDDVVTQRYLPWPLAALLGPINRFVTTGFLPAAFREQMGYDWSRQDEQRFERLMGCLFSLNRRLPAPVRRFPFNALLWDVRRRARTGKPLV